MKKLVIPILMILYSCSDINLDNLFKDAPSGGTGNYGNFYFPVIVPINLGSPLAVAECPKELFWIDSTTLIINPLSGRLPISKIDLQTNRTIPIFADNTLLSIISAKSKDVWVKRAKSIDNSSSYQLFKMNLNTLKEEMLIDSIACTYNPSNATLLSNGGTIAWTKWQASENENIPDLYYMADSIPVKFARGYPISISPDGEKILYHEQEQLSVIKEYSISSQTTEDIYTDIDSRTATSYDIKYLNNSEIVACYNVPKLILTKLNEYSVLSSDSANLGSNMLVSSDSEYIAFYLYHETYELWVYSLIKGEMKIVTRADACSFPCLDYGPSGFAFSPDSKYLAYYYSGQLYSYELTF
jgi:hypothetical protein